MIDFMDFKEHIAILFPDIKGIIILKDKNYAVSNHADIQRREVYR